MVFIRELEPPRPKVAKVCETKLPAGPAPAPTPRPPVALGLPAHRRPWLVAVVVLLGLSVGGAVTLGLLSSRDDGKTWGSDGKRAVTTLKTAAKPPPEATPPPPLPPSPAPPVVAAVAPVEATTPPSEALAPEPERRLHRRRRGKRSGELSRGQLRRAMRRIRYKVKRCFWRRNKRGRAKVELSILGSGEVQSLRISRTPGKRVKLCVAKQVRKARFPHFRAASMTYAYTYIVR
jgi:hypothetical protein